MYVSQDKNCRKPKGVVGVGQREEQRSKGVGSKRAGSKGQGRE